MIRFTKIRTVKSPKRANKHDAGTDFFLPKITWDMVQDLKARNPHILRWGEIIQYESSWAGYPKELREYYLRITPGLRILIPSGIKVNIIEKETALIGFNKSGLSAMSGIIVTAQVVDADYTGEVHVGLLNTSDSIYTFTEGDKIGQFVHTPIIIDNFSEVTNQEYEDWVIGSDRGEGGFGSTDRK